jgi:hypothetical protein
MRKYTAIKNIIERNGAENPEFVVTNVILPEKAYITSNAIRPKMAIRYCFFVRECAMTFIPGTKKHMTMYEVMNHHEPIEMGQNACHHVNSNEGLTHLASLSHTLQ